MVESTAGNTAGIASKLGKFNTATKWAGDISSWLGVSTASLFIVSAISSLINMFHPAEAYTSINIFAAMGAPGDNHGGRVPSFAFWDVNGDWLGHNRKHHGTIGMGEHKEVKVTFGGSNRAPEYMAMAAQSKDAICVAALVIKWPESQGEGAVLYGDIPSACGMPFYHSRVRIKQEDGFEPLCFWIDGSGRSNDHRKCEESSPGCHDPPAGFSIHLSDVSGAYVNEYTAEQRNEKPELLCNHEARFKVWDDMRGKTSIPIFKEKPLVRGENGIDTPDFMSKEIEMSKPMRHYIAGRALFADIAKEKTFLTRKLFSRMIDKVDKEEGMFLQVELD